jgi:NADH-quinone oxidoreductase subunit K
MQYELAILQNYLTLGAILFAIGAVGLLCRRNMIVMFISLEMMLQGVSLSLVAWSRFHDDWDGQVLVIFIIAVAACEAAIALALVQAVFRRTGKLDIVVLRELRESGLPEFVEGPIEEESSTAQQWPRLPPAGIEPPLPREELEHRPRV